jgi:hypothetical protein
MKNQIDFDYFLQGNQPKLFIFEKIWQGNVGQRNEEKNLQNMPCQSFLCPLKLCGCSIS